MHCHQSQHNRWDKLVQKNYITRTDLYKNFRARNTIESS